MKESLYVIWDRLKPYVLLISAVTPIILILYNYFFGPVTSFQEAVIAFLFLEIGLLVAIAFEIQRKLGGLGQVLQQEVCSVSNNPIWKELEGRKIPSMDICALNGGRIAKCIQDHDITVGDIRAIFPSEEALKLFFSDLEFEKTRARMHSISIGFADFEHIMTTLEREGKVKKFQVLRVNCFTDRISIIPGDKFVLTGNYFPQSARSASTGLKVETRLEYRTDLVSREKEQFERLWEPS
ncbi:MAG: hypothetical protein AAF672_00145 [Pseudomonadota bacterium]